MFAYRAPLHEMRYWMRAFRGLNARLASSEFTTELEDAILHESARLSETVLAPINALGDREGARWDAGAVYLPAAFKEAYARFKEGGWAGLRAPVSFGGQGLPRVLSTPITEMWHAANLSFALCPLLSLSAIETLLHSASPDLQARYLPKLVSGEWAGTMNLTEPDAGSDLSRIRMRALPQGDHYRLLGQKIYITYGEHDLTSNIIHLVLARLPEAPPGVKGLSLFLVPKILVDDAGNLTTPNEVQCLSIERKLGIHASPTCVMGYGDREGAMGYLVGEPHRGIEHMFVMMNAARFSVGLQGVGLAERAYQQAVDYAKTRKQGVPLGTSVEEAAPIFEHPDVRRMLMRMRALVSAGRALQMYTAVQMDLVSHPDPGMAKRAEAEVELLTPLCKAWNTEMAEEVSSIALQVHGGMGYIEDTGIAQLYRDARITTIYEGTTGIQSLDFLGRKVLKDGGQLISALLLEGREWISEAQEATPVIAAIDEMLCILRGLLNTHKVRPHAPTLYVSAVPLMRAMGRVFAAILMIRALERSSDDPLHEAHVQVTAFFIEHVLSDCLGIFASIRAGGDSAFALPRESF